MRDTVGAGRPLYKSDLPTDFAAEDKVPSIWGSAEVGVSNMG